MKNVDQCGILDRERIFSLCKSGGRTLVPMLFWKKFIVEIFLVVEVSFLRWCLCFLRRSRELTVFSCKMQAWFIQSRGNMIGHGFSC